MVTRESAIEIVKAFVNECMGKGIRFYKVLLFGSFAKNLAHEHSDIDLLLISDQFSDNIFENLKIYSKINIKYPRIETHPYTTAQYLANNEFINEIIKESITIA
ncbi:MAG: nucleotidyltransferase domain-containing protein [bacterium]